MGNLIVADSEYMLLQEKYLTLGEKMEHQIIEYTQILNEICESSITSGAVYSNLMSFKGECEGVKAEIKEIANLLSQNMRDYIDKIDDKDQYIY